MMLYYGQAPQTFSKGVRRRNTQISLETFARERRLEKCASEFVQCVSSHVNASISTKSKAIGSTRGLRGSLSSKQPFAPMFLTHLQFNQGRVQDFKQMF